jgi:hypothetical protein
MTVPYTTRIEPPIYTAFTSTVGGLLSRELGWLIREVTDSDVNHACIIYWSRDWGCWMTVGANSNGITEIPLLKFEQSRLVKHLFSAAGFSLWDGLRAHVGDVDKSYAYSGLFGMAFVEILKKLNQHPHYNWFENKDELFCSQWAAEIVDAALPEDSRARWPLFSLDSSVIDPGRLYNAEAPSFFSEMDASVLQMPWKPARARGYGTLGFY